MNTSPKLVYYTDPISQFLYLCYNLRWITLIWLAVFFVSVWLLTIIVVCIGESCPESIIANLLVIILSGVLTIVSIFTRILMLFTAFCWLITFLISVGIL